MSAAAQAPINLARQGVDSLAGALRIISDLTAQEVALMVGIVRERASLRPAASTAEKVITGFADGGKILLDLAAGESELFVDGLKETLHLPASVAALANLFPIGVGTIVAMHKRMLDKIGEQTKEVVASFTEGKPLMAGEKAARFAWEGIESFIETQKTFLDQVAEQVTIATGGKQAKAARGGAKELTKLAEEGVDKFIQAQKQVLALMIEQADAMSGAARKAAQNTSLAELTRKSVQNFTAAQKSLLDLAIKPAAAASEAPKAKARAARRRPKPGKRAAAAATAE